MNWGIEIKDFLLACQEEKVEMILIGGGAVNFHGYQRHSADLDFWINPTKQNFRALTTALQSLGYDIEELPEKVLKGQQNVSIKFSPENSLGLELITAFSLSKDFNTVLNDSEIGQVLGEPVVRYRILSLDDLIESKIRSGRPKDLLDIQELQKLRGPKGQLP